MSHATAESKATATTAPVPATAASPPPPPLSAAPSNADSAASPSKATSPASPPSAAAPATTTNDPSSSTQDADPSTALHSSSTGVPSASSKTAATSNGGPRARTVSAEKRPGGSKGDAAEGESRNDSDAETDILPGKDDVASPVRRIIRHERSESTKDRPNHAGRSIKREDVADATPATANADKESRAKAANNGASARHASATSLAPGDTNNSSNLSSSASTPSPADGRSQKRASSEASQSAASRHSRDADATSHSSSRKRKARPDEPEDASVKRRHRREDSHSDKIRTASHDRPSEVRKTANSRSASPAGRRQRTLSLSTTQAAAAATKRKKPAPIQLASGRARASEAADESDDSDPDGTDPSQDHPHLQRLTSGDQQSILSPAKMPAHKKLRDKNGRTFLARACASHELANVKLRLKERPEDLNVADNAGNTPLQIAALEGYSDIVQVLLEAHCDVNCRNIDMDTPLIDAVENDHLDVIRLLVKAGVDARQPNAKGEEPLDLLDPEQENYVTIKATLERARERDKRRRPSEDQSTTGLTSTKDPVSIQSPHESPILPSAQSPPPTLLVPPHPRRAARREATRNDLLWVSPTPELLREKAGMGDNTAVDHILNMRPMGDIGAVIAAAKGGHELCLQLITAIGNPDPDPDPLPELRPGQNTPMLAAIGKGHPSVVRTLCVPEFNPTRRLFRNYTYHELARERAGPSWQEEYDILKEAYDRYRAARGSNSKSDGSPKSVRSNLALRQSDLKKLPRDKRSVSPARETKKLKRASASPTRTQRRVSPAASGESAPLRRRLTLDSKEGQARRDRERLREGTNHTTSGVDGKAPAAPDKESERRSKHLNVPTKSRVQDVSTTVTSDRDKTSSLVKGNKEKRHAASLDDKDHPESKPLKSSADGMASTEAGATKPRKRLVPGKALQTEDGDVKRRISASSSLTDASSSQTGSAAAHKKSTSAVSIKTEEETQPTKDKQRSRELREARDSKVNRDGREATRSTTEGSKKRLHPHSPSSTDRVRDKESALTRSSATSASPQNGGKKVKRPRVASEERVTEPKKDASPSRPSTGHAHSKSLSFKSTDTSGKGAPVAFMGDTQGSTRQKTSRDSKDVKEPKESKDSNDSKDSPALRDQKNSSAATTLTERSRRAVDEEPKSPVRTARKRPEDVGLDPDRTRAKHAKNSKAVSPEKTAKNSAPEEQATVDAPKKGIVSATELAAADEDIVIDQETKSTRKPLAKDKSEQQGQADETASAASAQSNAEEEQQGQDGEEDQDKKLAEKAKADAEAEAEAAAAAAAAAVEAARLRAEEEKRAREDAEAEAARIKAEAEAEQSRREEEQRRQQEREENERRAQAERERQERERQAEIRRHAEEERRRLDALPKGLRLSAEISTVEGRRSSAIAQHWLPLYTARGSQLDAHAAGPEADELWVANVQIAPILGITDLALSQYTAWPRPAVHQAHRLGLWRVLRRKLTAFDVDLQATGTVYDAAADVAADRATAPRFLDLQPLLWIRLSDFFDVVPRFEHLRGLKIRTKVLSTIIVPPLLDGQVVDNATGSSLTLHNGIDASHGKMVNGTGTAMANGIGTGIGTGMGTGMGSNSSSDEGPAVNGALTRTAGAVETINGVLDTGHGIPTGNATEVVMVNGFH